MNKTWFIDFDGTLVFQKSHYSAEDHILPGVVEFFQTKIKKNDYVVITTAREEAQHKARIKNFLEKNNLRFDFILCGLPSGPRVVMNDTKPDGTVTAVAIPLKRDAGLHFLIEPAD
jgi:hypothetical protein